MNVLRGGSPQLLKVHPLIGLIIPLFSCLCSILELSLDEVSIAVKGRSILNRYNPKKQNNMSIKQSFQKVWVLLIIISQLQYGFKSQPFEILT